ncbi:hypothetical protein TSMEX_000201, partial [Taenia solium]
MTGVVGSRVFPGHYGHQVRQPAVNASRLNSFCVSN